MKIAKKCLNTSSLLVFFFLVFVLGTPSVYSLPVGSTINFSSAKVVVSDQLNAQEYASLQMFLEEVKSRTLISLPYKSEWPSSSTPTIVIGTRKNLKGLYGPFSQDSVQNNVSFHEGFKIYLSRDVRKAPTIFIVGNDSRGMLYGIGYLLRKSFMNKGNFLISRNISTTSHPALPLRGHQLGYRPKTNSYDGFTPEMWENYIQDLIVFGANTIELIPPKTDDSPESPMFTLSQMDMMVRMVEIIEKYGLNSWVWYPMVYGDYSKSEIVEKSLAENKEIFSRLPKIDAVFVPGGDPGHTSPTVMFDYLEKAANLLHRYHPNAEMWVSPQGFEREWMDDFYALLREKPNWLTGIVYGPNVRVSLGEVRKNISEHYPIRRYPDITHNYDSQYPVPNWDFAFASTENRESINPRPTQQKIIFNAVSPKKYCGFVTYSEGINDDVNKMIWSRLGWNPEADIIEILRDYSRYFIGSEYEHEFAQGLLDLEKNWDGPLLGNTSVYSTLYKFQSMEERALPKVRLNWRFQSVLFRSYYDAYNRSRLLYETQLEDKAISVLRRASDLGSFTAMKQAEGILEQAKLEYVAKEWRQRLFELAEALFQSIHMQKSVKKYFAKRVGRGANLDLVNYPLNNHLWLEEQFSRIREIDSEKDRLAEIKKIVNWQNSGPGGFYDDLGNLANQPHLVSEYSYEDDPSFLSTSFVGFTVGNDNDVSGFTEDSNARNWRISWARYIQTRYNQPLKLHYSNLDTSVQYKVRVVYTGDNFDTAKIRLVADGNREVHSYIKKPFPVHPLEFNIPREATQDGELTLKWNQQLGLGGNGRGCQIAEVWLIKKQEP